jgi:hypothetical protein
MRGVRASRVEPRVRIVRGRDACRDGAVTSARLRCVVNPRAAGGAALVCLQTAAFSQLFDFLEDQ